MSYVTVLLGGSLRALHPEARDGEFEVAVDGPLRIEEFLERTNVPTDQARMLMLNHRKADLDTEVQPGDRLAVFPPSLAFNMYVALELAHSGQTEEDIAAASTETTGHGDPDKSQ